MSTLSDAGLRECARALLQRLSGGAQETGAALPRKAEPGPERKAAAAPGIGTGESPGRADVRSGAAEAPTEVRRGGKNAGLADFLRRIRRDGTAEETAARLLPLLRTEGSAAGQTGADSPAAAVQPAKPGRQAWGTEQAERAVLSGFLSGSARTGQALSFVQAASVRGLSDDWGGYGGGDPGERQSSPDAAADFAPGGAAADAEAISERFRRDSRRYDNGF